MKLISEEELTLILRIVNPSISGSKLKDLIDSYPDYKEKEFDNYNYD